MLLRKMLRDLSVNKGSYLACTAIIAIGITIYNVFSIGYDNFYISLDTYYKTYHFADGFAEFKSMPITELKELSQIPGIKVIGGRYIKDVKYVSNDKEYSVYLRLISYNPSEKNALNGFKVLEGKAPEDGYKVIIDNNFYKDNLLKVGDQLEVIYSGKKVKFEVTGACQSPEYIYSLRNEQDIYPDTKTFGIAFVPESTIDSLNGQSNQINQISFLLEDNVSYDVIEDILEKKLKPFGLKNIYPRKDQTSHLILSKELEGMGSMSKVMPALFLMVSVMIMYIMLKRVISSQRQQIGVIKALGYSDKKVLLHYLSYSLIVGGFGGAIGGIIGNVLVVPFSAMFQQMFNMPLLKGHFSLKYFLGGTVLALIFSAIAGYQGAKESLVLEPSEAMRPPTPKVSSPTSMERFSLIWNRLNLQSRIALRNIFRNKGKSIFILIGMTFTVAILGMPWSMKNILESMIYNQFEKVQTFDMKMTLSGPVDYFSAIREINKIEGVDRVEGMLEVPVKLYNKGVNKPIIVYGLEDNSEFYHVYDENNEEISLLGNGITISKRVAEILDVELGDTIYVESTFMKEKEQKKSIIVERIVPQYLGLNAFMNDFTLIDFLEQKPFITSIMLASNAKAMEFIEDEYKNSDIVFGVDEQKDIRQKYNHMMELFMSMMTMLCIFGLITGFGVIYASSIISISERQRELASMLVIGMSYKEIQSIVTIEQWVLSSFAIITGIPLMKLMVMGMSVEMKNDVYTMPTNLSFMAVATSLLMTGISISIAQVIIKKKISRINLIDSLSIKE